MKASERVLVNTIAQYTRTFVSMVLSLYTVRVVLNCLGQSDFGVYNLVAGVVAMLSFFTNSLSSTTQRFISFYQGKGIVEEIKNIFSNSLIVHIVVGLILVFVLELILPLLFQGFLNISPERTDAAKTVYQTVVIMIFVIFLKSPFTALLISHENIVYISLIEIVEAFMKVGLVIMMSHSSYDKLICYALIMLSLHLFVLFAFGIFCYLKYDECVRPSLKRIKKQYITDICSFAGWTIYGAACLTGRDQGISIVLNRAYGTIINGAWGIGTQVSGYTNVLSGSIVNAMRPQIVKAEGSGDRKRAIWLSNILSKMVFFLMSIIGIPFIFEINDILGIWLGNPPENSSFFCVMFICALLFESLTTGMTHINNAIGNIRTYSILMTTPKLFTLLFAIILVRTEYSLLSIGIVYVSIEAICSFMRIPLVAKQSGLVVSDFFKTVIYKELKPACLCAFVCYLCISIFDFKYRFVFTTLVSAIVYAISMYYWGLTKKERTIIHDIIRELIQKFSNNANK